MIIVEKVAIEKYQLEGGSIAVRTANHEANSYL